MRLSIRNLGAGFAGAVALLVVGQVTVSVLESNRNTQLTAQALEIAEAKRNIYRAALPLSFERSLTQVGLSLDTPLPAPFRTLLTEQRRLADVALQDLRRGVEVAVHLSNTPSVQSEIRAVADSITAVRQRADRAIMPRSLFVARTLQRYRPISSD
jgi:hypothetical protein